MNEDNLSKLESLYCQIYSCHKCSRAQPSEKPKQAFKQYLTSKLFIIGQSVAESQVRVSGIPYHYLHKDGVARLSKPNGKRGKSGGEVLEPYLNKVGYTLSPFNPNYMLAYTTDIVKCYLGKKPNGDDNPPRKEEIDNCKGWLLEESALIQFRILLLLGRPATKVFRQILGKSFTRASDYYRRPCSFRFGNSDIPVYVLPHPSPNCTVKGKKELYDSTFEMIKKHL